MQKSKGCLPNGKGLNWLREGNFNFKLQVNVTNDVAKKKASTENVLSKHEHCGDGES